MNYGSRPHLWGWTFAARVALAGLALGFAALIGSRVSPGRLDPEINPSLVLDPNTAPPAVLLALPRLGPTMVGRIVAERERRPFGSLEDFDARVRGIGPATAAALRPHLVFGPEQSAGTVPPAPAPLATRVSRSAPEP